MKFEQRDFQFASLSFERAILDSLAANIAVIDSWGEILAVNASWQKFAEDNHMRDVSAGVGANYLDVCRSAIADPNARLALEGILHVINGRQHFFYHEYPCHSPWQKRWFALRATPVVDYPECVVLSHEDITQRNFAVTGDRRPLEN